MLGCTNFDNEQMTFLIIAAHGHFGIIFYFQLHFEKLAVFLCRKKIKIMYLFFDKGTKMS